MILEVQSCSGLVVRAQGAPAPPCPPGLLPPAPPVSVCAGMSDVLTLVRPGSRASGRVWASADVQATQGCAEPVLSGESEEACGTLAEGARCLAVVN